MKIFHWESTRYPIDGFNIWVKAMIKIDGFELTVKDLRFGQLAVCDLFYYYY